MKGVRFLTVLFWLSIGGLLWSANHGGSRPSAFIHSILYVAVQPIQGRVITLFQGGVLYY